MSMGRSSRPYFEHDDRDTRTVQMDRRRKFNKRNFRHNRHYGDEGGSRNRRVDYDGDIDMVGVSKRSKDERFKPYQMGSNFKKNKDSRKKNRGKGGGNAASSYRRALPLSNIQSSENSWFKIKFGYVGNAAVFYVNEVEQANGLKKLNGIITTPSGFKMSIYCQRCPPPVCTLNDETQEKIKVCMSNRYDVAQKLLNLSNFYCDSGLKTEGIYAPLSRFNIFSAVVRIIKEHIPELEKLDLSGNKLNRLEPLSSLVSTCKELKSLILGNNCLSTIGELNFLKGLELQELYLDGNPLCDKFKDQSSYISAVRERLPKTIRLDGKDLPPPITFDLDQTVELPKAHGSYFPSDDVKLLIIQFLEQYYVVYDSGDRQQLLEAYHDHAMFSLFVSKQSSREAGPDEYIHESRNLLRIKDSNFRNRLLKFGRLAVVSALSELPASQHEPSSFTVDVGFVLPTLMNFTVSGVFRGVGKSKHKQQLWTFSRAFVVVPQGRGFSVVNDNLFISNASHSQVEAYKLTPTPSPISSPGPSTEKSLIEKKQMVEQFMRQTGMNESFSAKCLEENEWNYQKSALVFNELNMSSLIPSEAFQK
ncbi:nuclear RNA export factor 1-like [Limulus polyphemus]|uniref:Nuclear RNA export factor 1-like n=1 Tax=Limulus polyphemus TaxID=6850 RepID=A0ABM1BHQ4_LIMPO|nr:nuclear RNA export factor 1-like [Limulus polyphemus]